MVFEDQETERSGLVSRIQWNFKLPDGVERPDCCPHCGGEEFYRKLTFSGKGECNYRFDGLATNNSTLHDGVNYNEKRSVFCRDCDRQLGIEKSEKKEGMRK